MMLAFSPQAWWFFSPLSWLLCPAFHSRHSTHFFTVGACFRYWPAGLTTILCLVHWPLNPAMSSFPPSIQWHWVKTTFKPHTKWVAGNPGLSLPRGAALFWGAWLFAENWALIIADGPFGWSSVLCPVCLLSLPTLCRFHFQTHTPRFVLLTSH